jgi:hypothetical protein
VTDDTVDESSLKSDNAPTNDYVLTAKSSAAGGLTWAAAAGGGKLLQVVIGEDSTQTVIATTTYTDSGLSATITPSATTSKILIMWNTLGTNPGSYRGWGTQLVRGSTNIWTSANLLDTLAGASADFRLSRSFYYIDEPSTTSATTYKTQNATYSGGSITFNDGGNKTQMVLMEIGA